ncbi:MAG: hypothetical protein Q8L87_19455 [Anaerolineales bacterium]|nr:hypothetical protein [Anaerolineales bacterium]
MKNLFSTQDSVDFWVWVNPNNWLTKHQIKETGGFTSGGIFGKDKSNLMFIPNPDFRGELTPFHNGIMRDYVAEYNIELSRMQLFPQYPSRLNALYLFRSEEEAQKYSIRHKWHVGERILKKCHSITPYTFSLHDLSWVDFLRASPSIDPPSLDIIGKAYWNGKYVESYKLEIMGEKWICEPIIEVLFIGRVEFYDRSLE